MLRVANSILKGDFLPINFVKYFGSKPLAGRTTS